MLSIFSQATFFIITILFSADTYAQTYFQQEADYKIIATLDTIDQTLDATLVLSYTNNSPDVLSEMYFHVWWNAYSDKKSAYAEQALMIGDRDFHFSNIEDQGAYSNLKFSINNNEIHYKNHVVDGREHCDIAVIALQDPVASGAVVDISIEFTLDIPYAFSRAGLKEDLYRMTQWYPKPAVYDHNGWHPMPYLEMGEYYSEFGDYELEINMPASYSIACTGIVDESRTIYDSNGKTLYISADNVIDFAWFASEYYVPYREAMVIDDKRIAITAFVREESEDWEDILKYARRALSFYSEEVGPYPYPQVTIVEESTGAGGAMEYPMITLIDTDNSNHTIDHLVTHEIGHNWFQAVLASDERTYPWMDEGINSYYEQKYIAQNYQTATYDELFAIWKNRERDYTFLQSAIINLERTNRTRPINSHSDDLDPINYVSMSYEKIAWGYDFLSHYLGERQFNEAIQAYYSEWSFRHPSPDDFREIIENETEKDLSWFFTDFLNSDGEIDLAIVNTKTVGDSITVKVMNVGDISLPFSLDRHSKISDVVLSDWHDVLSPGESREITYPSEGLEKVMVNGVHKIADINQSNNIKNQKGLFNRPLKFQFFGGPEQNEYNQVAYFPSIFANEYDGIMLGMHATNSIFPLKNTRWHIAPHYGIKSNRLSGLAKVERDFLAYNKGYRKWTVGLLAQSFAYDEFEELSLAYQKLVPEISLHFDRGIFNNSYLQYKLHYINQENLAFTPEANPFKESQSTLIHQLSYHRHTTVGLSDNVLLLQLEYENYDKPFGEKAEYLKLSASYDKRIYYNPTSQFHIRFFGGYFPIHSERESSSYSSVFAKGSFALTSQGFTDHLFEEYYFARSGKNDNSASAQINIAEGGFKNAFGSAFRTGFSNDYLLAINLKLDLPLSFLKDIKIRPYLDMAYSSTKDVTADPLSGQFLYSGGMSIEVSNALGVYIPLLHSSSIRTNYSGTKIWDRISFVYNLKTLNPWKLQDDPASLLR